MSRSNTHPSVAYEGNYQLMELFAVVNGEILKDLGENVSPTYTRIHYLLRGLSEFPHIKVSSISFKQLNRKDPIAVLYNNIVKSVVAIRTVWALIKNRPLVYFAYPHSLTTVQNRVVFRLCKMINLKTILDIHDTIEQASVVGSGKSTLNEAYEGYCFRESTLLLPSIDGALWRRLQKVYEITDIKKIVYVPNAFEEEFIDYYPEPYKSQGDRFNVCYIGRITKNRGVELLVQACVELHGRYPQLRLLLFGTYGEGMLAETKNIISKSDFIIMREIPRKDIPRSFGDIDLFVMPYNPHEVYMSSITPTKFFEYIGTGKPILCTKCESLEDIDSEGCIVYVDFELEDFKTKMEMLIKNPELREEMSKKLLMLREKHTWTERANRIYKKLAEK
jgi:glycosyltransferase involved in cell wall biosynthesis